MSVGPRTWKDGRLQPCSYTEFARGLRRYAELADREFGTRSDPVAHLGERLNAAADVIDTLIKTAGNE